MPIDKMALMLRPDKEAPDGMSFYLSSLRHICICPDDDVKVAEIDVPFDIPENMTHEDILQKAVETLEEKKNNAWAQAQQRVNILQERINKLRMLTHNPTPPVDHNEEGQTYEHNTGTDFGSAPLGDDDIF